MIANLKWLIPMAFDDRSLPLAIVMDRGIGEASNVDGTLKQLAPPALQALTDLISRRAEYHDYQAMLFDGADHGDGAKWHEAARKQCQAALDALAAIPT